MSEKTVGTKECAEMLGVTRGYFTRRVCKRPDFPAPFINRSQKMRRWRLSDFQRWMTGKPSPSKARYGA